MKYLLLCCLTILGGTLANAGKTGIVIVDVQKNFISKAVNTDISQIVENNNALISLSKKYNVPLFITYEAGKTGRYALPSELKRTLPVKPQEFIKSTYASTGLSSFSTALDNSKLDNVIVSGSETDVCVLQTVLGLIDQGFNVLVQSEAIFSSEINISPAVQRLKQAGATFVSLSQTTKILNGTLTAPKSKKGTNSILVPFKKGSPNVAIILNHLDESEISSVTDKFKQQKLQRQRELLIYSEWFQIPTYVIGSNSAQYTLPNSLKKIMTSQIQQALNSKKWLEYSSFPQNKYEQIIVLGVDKNLDVLIKPLKSNSQVFLMQDALLGKHLDPQTIPVTLKSFYYGMTKSIDINEWPSQAWASRDPTFYKLTVEPESLAPINHP